MKVVFETSKHLEMSLISIMSSLQIDLFWGLAALPSFVSFLQTDARMKRIDTVHICYNQINVAETLSC